MNKNARLVKDQEFLAQITNTGMHASGNIDNVFDTRVQEEMSAAQNVLLQNGYRLTDASMIEGHFYLQRFTSRERSGHEVQLRFIDRGTPGTVRLSLGYYDSSSSTGVVVFGDRPTHGTGTSDASKMLTRLAHQPKSRRMVWIPAFKNSPFII